MTAPSIPDVADLVAAEQRGEPLDPLFFWGHRPRPDGALGPSCLSQWWPAPFAVDGVRFATAEHFMMWAKAVRFGDGAIAGQVLADDDPAAAKRRGRNLLGTALMRVRAQLLGPGGG